MIPRPNILVLGASGGVANAFFHYLSAHRSLFGKLIVIDKRNTLLDDEYLDHQSLSYHFIKWRVRLPRETKRYHNILHQHNIRIVVDLTDAETIPLMLATAAARVHYINTGLNAANKTVDECVKWVYEHKNQLSTAAFILCAGMNPGVVNMWVRCGIEKYGVPKEVVHFEYDTSTPAMGWKPMVTWSLQEFIVETCNDPGGVMLSAYGVKQMLPNAIKHRESMKPILKPIMTLDDYPRGMPVLHEENVTIARRYKIPSKFIYAVHPKTMSYITRIYNKKGKVRRSDLFVGDNKNLPLIGEDGIGVMLEYKDKRVYYYNSMPNVVVAGTNATYLQVVSGVFAAISTLLFDKLAKGVYFTEDLFGTNYRHYMFDNLRVQEFVFKKRKGKLKLSKYIPAIKVRRRHSLKHLRI